MQNRLEFTINSLAIEEENLIASESAIRDASIAKETIGFTRNQILVAAGTSVLAQANVVPQTALQLLG
jgi:flagellin